MTVSIRRRFAFTVTANLFRSLLSITTGVLLARWLGPESYGNMAFLLGSFVAVRQLMDMGSSSAFLTFLSQRARSKRFVQSFLVWLAVQLLIPLCIVGLLFPSQWVETIWKGEQRILVLLAFVAVFMQQSAWSVVQQIGESQRQTLWVQGVGVVVVGVHLLAVILLWWIGILGLYAIFVTIALEYFMAAVVAYNGLNFGPTGRADSTGRMQEPGLREYLRYCFPLIPFSLCMFAYEFADRWLLQSYGGGIEQAYYSVGAGFSGIALIATSSILSIFWKEIAEAHHQGNRLRTGVLYQKVSRLLFLVGATISGFFIPWAAALLNLFLGAAYTSGATTLAIMFLYPAHQSMGQIGGTMLYATERVSIRVVIGIVFMIASMGMSYLVLAPADAAVPGLGLASEGLAIKMVVMQIISVNAIAFIIARISSWRFDWVYQPVSLLGCIALGWVAMHVVVGVLGHEVVLPMAMGLAALIYLLLMALFIYGLPWLAGMTRDELVGDVHRAWYGASRFWRS